MAASRKYHMLFVREDDVWVYEFGDYDKEAVVFERQDWLDHFNDDGSKRRQKDTLLVTAPCAVTQQSIDKMVAQLRQHGKVLSIPA